MAQTIAPRISAFAIYQRSKEDKENEEKRRTDKTKVQWRRRIRSYARTHIHTLSLYPS